MSEIFQDRLYRNPCRRRSFRPPDFFESKFTRQGEPKWVRFGTWSNRISRWLHESHGSSYPVGLCPRPLLAPSCSLL